MTWWKHHLVHINEATNNTDIVIITVGMTNHLKKVVCPHCKKVAAEVTPSSKISLRCPHCGQWIEAKDSE